MPSLTSTASDSTHKPDFLHLGSVGPQLHRLELNTTTQRITKSGLYELLRSAGNLRELHLNAVHCLDDDLVHLPSLL